jgi:hypothetical protein
MRSVTESENVIALEASYSVSYLIAESGAAEVIGETLIKPVAKVMAGDNASKATASFRLSKRNTVHRRITDMTENEKQQLLLRVRQSRYCALQADESTA